MANFEDRIAGIMREFRESVEKAREEAEDEDQRIPVPVVFCMLCLQSATTVYVSKQHGVVVEYDVCKSHVSSLKKAGL